MKHLLVLVLSALITSVVFAQPYTADRHLARKAPCQACHVTGDTSVPVRKENCLVCHQSYEVVAQKTKDLKPNPHFNHYGERDCSTCHFGHKPSVTSCNQCHKFDLKTPERLQIEIPKGCCKTRVSRVLQQPLFLLFEFVNLSPNSLKRSTS